VSEFARQTAFTVSSSAAPICHSVQRHIPAPRRMKDSGRGRIERRHNQIHQP